MGDWVSAIVNVTTAWQHNLTNSNSQCKTKKTQSQYNLWVGSCTDSGGMKNKNETNDQELAEKIEPTDSLHAMLVQ